MELRLKRTKFLPKATMGELYINGVFECYTLEDKVRQTKESVIKWKIPGKTAIPTGKYEMSITMSNRFKKLMPLLHNVAGFEGVRIHSGNTDEDTEGCILVGQTQLATTIGASRLAFDALFNKMLLAANGKKESLTIIVE